VLPQCAGKSNFVCVLRVLCVFCFIQIIWGLDKVTLLNPPEEPLPEHLLKILYSCDEPATVQLHCIISFETGITSTLLLRQWRCLPGDPKISTVELKLPDWLVYQADGIVPDSQWVLSCILRASLRYSGFDGTKLYVAAQDAASLQPRPFYSRPVKQHKLCMSWRTQMLQLTQRFLTKQCPLEQETVHLLSSIYASTGESFGITKTLKPYRDEVLEYFRVKAISFPWCMFSIWIFVTRYCQEGLCGILYHINSQNNYITPALFLTNSGQLHIQMSGELEESSAFLPSFTVPMNEWCQLGLMLQVVPEAICRRINSMFHRLRHTIILDDTEGYFVIGGGKYVRGVAGFFGPVVYYRSRMSPHSTVTHFICTHMVWYVCHVFMFSHGATCVMQAWLLALLAAQKDDRLALLHLGHLHHMGLHGAPRDPDLAYGYYANIGKQTTLDRHNPTPNQTFVEAVYLNNDEVLDLQTNEDHHIFQWLKLQARRGAAEAEQTLARMLFWGQQGVSPNIQKAVRHYERGAVQLGDPVSMYDYGIVLMQGQGVEKDIPKALTFLKKAMEKGFVPAINALAWYYEQFERDYKKAVELWEQADVLESPDAALNLAVMYSQGLYPGKAADQVSSTLKHLLLYLQTFTERPLDAVLWVKWAAEQNGYLGTILRKALDSYLRRDMFSSQLYYIIAAESGYAPAQFNVAYLCEQNTGYFLDPAFASHCVWRYYNLTIQSPNPDTYALIRMGDLLYEGQGDGQKDISSAAEMYKQAALKNEPQGWYNLGLLAEEGYRLPLSVLIELGLSELYLADKSVLLSTLYKRCVYSEDTASYVPCSLALLNVYLHSFQKDYSAAIKVSVMCSRHTIGTVFLFDMVYVWTVILEFDLIFT
uniref:Uncharacterized protein n=1 Tax=Anabas testudineus TaxID=64144 RepID=A0A3Q1IED6_ANATE